MASGVDTAPWAYNLHEQGCQPTGSVNFQYIDSGGHDSFYGGMNSFNKGNFGFNNLQECIESYTHKFNEIVWTTFEVQYMWTNGCATGPTYKVPYEDGFFPTHTGKAWDAGIVNYTCFRIAPNAFFTSATSIGMILTVIVRVTPRLTRSTPSGLPGSRTSSS
jgi:hypothetical protein